MDIFISYRQSDGINTARLITKSIDDHFGKDCVFLDVKSIKKGIDFESEIELALLETKIFIVLIGSNFFQENHCHDVYFHEIDQALKANKNIYPILIDGSSMPTKKDLPDNLSRLANINARRVSSKSFDRDMSGVISDIETIFKNKNITIKKSKSHTKSRNVFIAVLSIILISLITPKLEVKNTILQIPIWFHAITSDSPEVISSSYLELLKPEIQLAKIQLHSEIKLLWALIRQKEYPANSIWSMSQLIAALGNDALDYREEYKELLVSTFDNNCRCFQHSGFYPHIIRQIWAIIGLTRVSSDIPKPILKSLLELQNEEGWWSLIPSTTSPRSEASTHLTSLAIIALAETLRGQKQNLDENLAITAAIKRAISWLHIQRPNLHGVLVDYPYKERRLGNDTFRHMAFLAYQAATQAGVNVEFNNQEFSNHITLPPQGMFSSSDSVLVYNGKEFADNYRHIPYPWASATAFQAIQYNHTIEQVKIASMLLKSRGIDTTNSTYHNQNWVLAETVFLFDRFILEHSNLKKFDFE